MKGIFLQGWFYDHAAGRIEITLIAMQIGAWEALQTLIMANRSMHLTSAEQCSVLIKFKNFLFSQKVHSSIKSWRKATESVHT